MKFLCPSCKAKYQIADEKVAGRSVRMKCRKCGHVIHVTSADAVANSSAPPPEVDPDNLTAEPVQVSPSKTAPLPGVAPTEKSKPGAGSLKVALPGQSKQTLPLGKLPSPAVAALGAAAAAAAKPRMPTPARPAAGNATPAPASRVAPPPKPPGVGVPRAGDKPPAPSLKTASRVGPAKPAAPSARSATGTPLPTGALGLVKFESPSELEDDEQTRIAGPGALAGAFSVAVTEHAPAAIADPLSMPGDEWFVGINGVPVGPIKLSELRTKAAAGAISKESLVWRDGFEEWRALKSFPELAAIVEEGQSSTRAAGPFDASGAKPFAAPAAAMLADPFAAPAVSPSGVTPGAVTGSAVVTDDLEGAFRRRSRTSPMAWIAMVVAMLFGITLGFVFFGRAVPVEDKTDKPVASVATPTPSAAPVAAAANQASEEIAVTGDTKVNKGTSTGTKSSTKTETDKPGSGLKLGNLSGLSPGGGPKAPGDSSGSTGSGGSQLDTGQLQSTVARYTPGVKRSCWQPALDTRDKDAPTSARVSVAITIGPSGTVQNVTNNGDPKGYRGLANCISGRVRGWQFPPSSGSTTVNVPFVFVAQ